MYEEVYYRSEGNFTSESVRFIREPHWAQTCKPLSHTHVH